MSPSVFEMKGIYATWGGGWSSFFDDVPLVEFMCNVFTCIPGRVTVGDSGLCTVVPLVCLALLA